MTKKRSRRNPSFIDLEDLRYFCQEKGFTEQDFFGILTSVVKRTLEEKADRECSIEVIIEEDRTVRVFNLAKVVISDEKFLRLDDEVSSQISFIPLRRARTVAGARVKEGDIVRDEVFLRNLPWLASSFSEAVSAEINRLHNQRIIEVYEDLVGKIIRVTLVARTRDGFLLRNVESSLAAKIFLPTQDVLKGKEPALNEIFDVYVKALDVLHKSVRIIVTTASNLLLIETLTKEIPELAQGLIKIKATARSLRHNQAKVAVAKADPESKIDPVGCFMGGGTSRLKDIIKTLKGERISVVNWDEDRFKFICEALAPAKVISVIAPKKKSTFFTVIIPDEHHSMAIGAQGANVALASLITNVSIDLIPLSKAIEKKLKFHWNGNISEIEVENLKKQRGASGSTNLRDWGASRNAFTSQRATSKRSFSEKGYRFSETRSNSQKPRRDAFRQGSPSKRFLERDFNSFDSYDHNPSSQEQELINAELERFQVDFSNNNPETQTDLFEEAWIDSNTSVNLQTRANLVGGQTLNRSDQQKDGILNSDKEDLLFEEEELFERDKQREWEAF